MSCGYGGVAAAAGAVVVVVDGGIVAVVGKTGVPSEQADHCVPKIHSVVVQSQGAGNACYSAVRVGPSFEAIVETVAEAAGEPLAALWGGAGEATLAG